MKPDEANDKEKDAALTKQIGARVQRSRRDKGLSQSELATVIKMTQASVSQIEQGHRRQVKVSVLAKIANALNTSTDYLITGKEASPHIGQVSAGLRHVIEEIASLPEDQQEEIGGAVQWLIEWRYSTTTANKGN